MRRIVPKKISLKDQEIRIEHYEPSSKNKELELDYQNFLGVCHGGIKDEREAMQKDINNKLQLNGELNAAGSLGYDTTSGWIASRKRIYDSVSNQFERWDKKKLLT